jgi:hypothetical protein
VLVVRLVQRAVEILPPDPLDLMVKRVDVGHVMNLVARDLAVFAPMVLLAFLDVDGHGPAFAD